MLELTVLGWLLDYAVSAGAIALVVLFQPELRRALEQIGHGKFLGKKAIKEMLPMQPGDVPATWADTTALEKATGYKPKTSLEEGVKKLAEWINSSLGESWL